MRHAHLQRLAELHLHLCAHGQGGQQGCGIPCGVYRQQACQSTRTQPVSRSAKCMRSQSLLALHLQQLACASGLAALPNEPADSASMSAVL